MRVLFIISGSDTAFWLSEVTHPYWHLTERGVDVHFASPRGGKVGSPPRPTARTKCHHHFGQASAPAEAGAETKRG